MVRLSVRGFTLLEMLVVLAIVAILAMLAMPSQQGRVAQKQVVESVGLLDDLKVPVSVYYRLKGQFPASNEEAGIPEAKYLIGRYVKSVQLQDGAFHLLMGSKVNGAIEGKIISVRPIVVIDSPASPVSWVCGFESVPEGMEAVGENKTSVERNFLPLSCRV